MVRFTTVRLWSDIDKFWIGGDDLMSLLQPDSKIPARQKTSDAVSGAVWDAGSGELYLLRLILSIWWISYWEI